MTAPARPNPAKTPQAGGSTPEPLATGAAPRIVDSAELFGGQSSLLIRHLGGLYRLQITRQGKLIMTK